MSWSRHLRLLLSNKLLTIQLISQIETLILQKLSSIDTKILRFDLLKLLHMSSALETWYGNLRDFQLQAEQKK
jgi:hypothetical protein